jgi:uncharacterized protein (TIGR00266 family)
MDIHVSHKGAFSSALVTLAPGERFISESAAMFRASSNIEIDVTTRSGGGTGGLLGGLKRLLAAENFFFSTYTCHGPVPGEVGLAPPLQGEVRRIDGDGVRRWICSGGSYLASAPHLQLDTQFQGFKGMFTGESMSFMVVSGAGPFLVSGFGRLSEIDLNGTLIVDTGHVVAFQDTLTYSPTKAGSSWVQTFLAGEGVVLKFSGQGKIIVQSHNARGFGKMLGTMLPQRS